MPPIDASDQSQARHAGYLTLAMLAALFVLLALPISEDARRGFPLFLPAHVGLEMLSVAIAALIFGTVWSARDEALPQGIVVMACAFLGVALLDFSHTLSYKGMPGFVTPASADQTIDFWLTARLLGDAGLLAMGSLAPRPARKWSHPSFVLGGVLLLVAAIHALVLQAPGWLPRSFVSGQGITAAATGSEYLVVALSLLAALLFWRRLREPRVFSHANACVRAPGSARKQRRRSATRADDKYGFLLLVDVFHQPGPAGKAGVSRGGESSSRQPRPAHCRVASSQSSTR